ncbi:MAG TPA: Xaa-Pro dipeptidyl-peptidase [Gaiellaceae bacterium]|nr:Xaa-Pro dipeptidyl-peptidase [Gaiellaceae bacterium]
MSPQDDSVAGRRRGAAARATPAGATRLLAAVATAAALAALALAAGPAAAQVTGPVFVDGQAQPVFSTSSATWVRQELWVESDIDSDFDGELDRIHIDVTRVQETETIGLRVPVVMEVSPYYGGSVDVVNWDVDHELGEPPATRPVTAPVFRDTSPIISNSHVSTWVPRGFAVVHAEGTGTGLSEGCPTTGDPFETLGPKAVIDWLNGRAKAFTSLTGDEQAFAHWTTGKVGMIGTSYNGTLPIGVATTGVEGLEAIVPISAISSWYDYYRANGAVRAPGGFQGEDADVLAEYTYTRPDQQICRPVIADIAARQDRVTGDYIPFWDARNYMNDVENVRAASLVAHGNNDWNVMTKHAAAYYEALKELGVPHQLYWHQGGHGGSPPLVRTNRWFSRYLWGHENGVENDPKAWVVREGQSSQNPTPYSEWPDPDARRAKLGFQGGAPGVGTLTGHDADPVQETIVDNATISAATLMNAASSPHRLLFKTPPLLTPLRISGTPTVTLKMAFDRPKANLTAHLISFPGGAGNGTVLSRGWIDPENRSFAAVTEPVTPGRMYRLTFDLQPKDSVVAAGRRLGVMVLSSDRDYTIRPAPGTELTMDVAESTVSLPVVGGPAALSNAFYDWKGFEGHESLPALNDARAGSVERMSFSLNGDRGLDVLADGSPASREVDCGTLAPLGALAPTRTPASQPFSYAPQSDRYVYPWQTEREWVGTCREFVLTLRDGTAHPAYLRFVK